MGLFKTEPKEDLKTKCLNEVSDLLLQGEIVEEVYPLIFDFMCMTNKRIIFVDKEIKDLKTSMYSISYDKIHGIGLVKNEKAFAFTDELKLVTKAKTFDIKFIKGTNIKEVYNKLSERLF